MTARLAMTPARKERIWSACLGRCEECQAPVPPDGPGVEFDHIIPLWTATDDERRAELELDANLQALCPGCHQKKTSAEAGPRGKAKRLAGETGQNRPLREIRSRGFDQRFTKGVNGKVRLRSPREADHG